MGKAHPLGRGGVALSQSKAAAKKKKAEEKKKKKRVEDILKADPVLCLSCDQTTHVYDRDEAPLAGAGRSS